MIIDIVANTQVKENYGTQDKPYWKPKGGQVFRFPVDDSFLYNSDEEITASINHMLSRQSNDMYIYELIDWVTQFHPDINVPGLENAHTGLFAYKQQ